MTAVISQSAMLGSGSSLTLNGSMFAVGIQGADGLKSVGSGLPSGVSVAGSAITVTTAGTVLDGYDFKGYSIAVQADNVTIANSLFNATGYHTIYQGPNATGMKVIGNTFDGQKANGTINGDMVLSENAANISNNEFFNLPADGVNTTGGLVEHNYFSGASYQTGAHADAISVHRTVAPLTIRENYIDFVKPADAAQGTNAALKVVSHFGTISDVTIAGNVAVGGGFNAYVGQDKYAVSNVTLTNNLMGLSEYGDKEEQFVMPGNHGSGFVMTGNSLYSGAGAGVAYAGGGTSAPPSAPVQQPSPPPAYEAASAQQPSPVSPVPTQTVPTPATPVEAPASGMSELTVRVSGDQYQGSPHFDLSVDGKVVAKNLSATGVHNNGEWTNLKVLGDFSKTSHEVSVTFTDDAWGGTNSSDKNLYVDYVELNGTRYEGESASLNKADPHAGALWSNGSLTFLLDHSEAAAPIATTPAPKPGDPIPPSVPSSPVQSAASDLPADTITSKPGQISITGTAGADVIYLNGSTHVTTAGGGDDIIVAGAVKDWMSGQGGNDTFVFQTASSSTPGTEHDIVNDFGFGRDKINLHLLEANAHQTLTWIGNGSFSGQAGELRTYDSGQSTFVEADFNGDKAPDFQLEMNKFALDASHFTL